MFDRGIGHATCASKLLAGVQYQISRPSLDDDDYNFVGGSAVNQDNLILKAVTIATMCNELIPGAVMEVEWDYRRQIAVIIMKVEREGYPDAEGAIGISEEDIGIPLDESFRIIDADIKNYFEDFDYKKGVFAPGGEGNPPAN